MARQHFLSFWAAVPILLDGGVSGDDGTQTGVLLDASRVEGLKYQTPTLSVTTDSAVSASGVRVFYTTNEGAFSTSNSVEIATLTGINTANINAADLSFMA